MNITQKEQLIDLVPSWWELIQKIPSTTTFQTPDYVLSWLNTLGQTVEIKSLAFYDQTSLVGLAPLCYWPSTQDLQFLGDRDVSDYLDFIFLPEYQTDEYRLLAATLLGLPIKKINLYSIKANSPTLQILPLNMKELSVGLFQAQIVQQDVCPLIQLPDNWEAYLAQLDRKQRHEIKRKWRKLDSLGHVEFVTVTSAQECEWAIDEFIRLHQLSSPAKAEFWTDQRRVFFHDFILALANSGTLRLTFLKLTDLSPETNLSSPTHPFVSVMLGFISHDQYLLYNSGFDPEYAGLSTGQVLTAYTIQAAIKEKLTVYDFMRGSEEYKIRLGGKPTEVFDLTLTQP